MAIKTNITVDQGANFAYNVYLVDVDGNLLVDPNGLLVGANGKYYQEHWIQDRKVPPVRRSGESADDQFMRGDQIQLDYDAWDSAPKLYGEDGCLKDRASAPTGTQEPMFCSKKMNMKVITLPDNSTVTALTIDAYENYDHKQRYLVKSPHAVVSLSVAALSILGLLVFWSAKKRS